VNSLAIGVSWVIGVSSLRRYGKKVKREEVGTLGIAAEDSSRGMVFWLLRLRFGSARHVFIMPLEFYCL
jgi:hypothetical protein